MILEHPGRRAACGRPTAAVITGSYGAGHDAAAREIRVRLLGAGWQVTLLDIADLYPLGLGHLLRRAYFRQLQLAPRSWGALLRSLEDPEDPGSRGGRHAAGLSGRLPARRVAEAIGSQADVVVSTHPFASQALGHLRDRGVLTTPVVTYLTDASVHPLWIHPSVDHHLAVHDEAARQARARGARDVRVIAPLTPVADRPTGRERDQLRALLGLAPEAPVALLSGGSEGAGEIAAAARDVRHSGAATPVVLCARNERLRRRLDREHGILTIGWLDGLTSAIRASDCVIQNSGGFTTLESLSLGVPLISYRCLPGHGEASAAALRVEGLAPWPRTTEQLGLAIRSAIADGCSTPPRRWADRSSFLDVLPGVLSGAVPVELVG